MLLNHSGTNVAEWSLLALDSYELKFYPTGAGSKTALFFMGYYVEAWSKKEAEINTTVMDGRAILAEEEQRGKSYWRPSTSVSGTRQL